MDVDSCVLRFVGIRNIINEILSISGAVGLSYGVIHHGRVIHIESFGFRDHQKRLPVESKTMFSICSMTKGLVTSALGVLVQKGKLRWDARLSQLLPGFAPRSAQLAEQATLTDVLTMRSGMERYNIWSQSDNRTNVSKNQSMKTINSLQSATDLRSEFAYNNWGYEIAEHVCQEVGGESWDSMLHTNFFEPLGLRRTDATGSRDGYDNMSKAYMVRDDGTPVEVSMTPQSGRTIMGAAGGVVSCVDDLLVIYGTMLKACVHQFENGTTATPGNPFQQLTTTMSAHTILPGPSYRESSYGMGWIRTELPNQMCKISPNYGLLGSAPVVGDGAPSKLIIAHYGSMPGSYSGVNLFPETESAIVVLTNTTPRCDLADWMTQLLTQTLFDFPQKNDYVWWVRKTVKAELGWHARITADMERNRKPGTPARPLDKYVGRYLNAAGTLFLQVRRNDDGLFILFEGREDEAFPLQHHQDDTFSWLQSRNELVSRARSVLQGASYYLIRFEAGQEETVDRLFWGHDSQMLNGEEYIKEQADSSITGISHDEL
jgi:CubicO group peptidase (beta-lactamase class C family)